MEKKILVIYKSTTGFTQKYAQLLSEKIPCTLLEYKAVTSQKLTGYDVIVFGTRAHAGRIDGFPKIKRLLAHLTRTQAVLFVTGACPNSAQEVITDFWNQNLTPQEQQTLPHFYLQSGLCYEKMPLPDKLMMRMAAAVMRRQAEQKPEKTPQDQQMAQAITASYDISSPQLLLPLIDYLQK